MPILTKRRGYTGRRSSEGDVALMQMQMEAHARNQRWHDFLCIKRDELQARLRQQGYSRSALPAPPLTRGRAPAPAIPPGAQDVRAAHSDGPDGPASPTTPWGSADAQARTLDRGVEIGDEQPDDHGEVGGEREEREEREDDTDDEEQGEDAEDGEDEHD